MVVHHCIFENAVHIIARFAEWDFFDPFHHINAAGARIVLGADTGLEDHPFGFAEQLELQAMVEAGMTPAQAIVAATSRAAAFLNLRDTGVLRAGQRADFLVLDANPLADITNTRRISRLVIGGVEVDRPSLIPLMR